MPARMRIAGRGGDFSPSQPVRWLAEFLDYLGDRKVLGGLNATENPAHGRSWRRRTAWTFLATSPSPAAKLSRCWRRLRWTFGEEPVENLAGVGIGDRLLEFTRAEERRIVGFFQELGGERILRFSRSFWRVIVASFFFPVGFPTGRKYSVAGNPSSFWRHDRAPVILGNLSREQRSHPLPARFSAQSRNDPLPGWSRSL